MTPVRRTIFGGVWARLDKSGCWHLANDDGTQTDYAVKKGAGLNEWDLVYFKNCEPLGTFDNFIAAAKAGNKRHNEDVAKWRKDQESKALNSFQGDYDD